MAVILKRISRLPFAPIVAGMFALVAATLVMATPIWLLENAVGRIGLSNMVSAAAPPLGMKARTLLALLAAFGTGAFLWAILSLAGKLGGKARGKVGSSEKPTEVKAFAPPRESNVQSDDEAFDLPRRRRPILADSELGAPFMSDEALASAPVLETPLEESSVSAPFIDIRTDEELDADELMLDQVLDADQWEDATPTHIAPIFAPAMPEERSIALEAPQADWNDFEIVEPFAPEVHAPVVAHKDLTFDIPVVVEPENSPHASSFEAAQPISTHIPLPPPVEGHSNESLGDLVDRVERGMAERAAALAATKATADAAVAAQAIEKAPVPAQPKAQLETAQEEVDSALRQALNTLERLAASSR